MLDTLLHKALDAAVALPYLAAETAHLTDVHLADEDEGGERNDDGQGEHMVHQKEKDEGAAKLDHDGD